MTPKEFKAWFEGFTEAFDRVPSKAQWERVKARVAEIDGRETTERIYVDRYISRYWPSYPGWQYLSRNNGSPTFTDTLSQYQGALGATAANGTLTSFNATTAMGALGRAEAQSLAKTR